MTSKSINFCVESRLADVIANLIDMFHMHSEESSVSQPGMNFSTETVSKCSQFGQFERNVRFHSRYRQSFNLLQTSNREQVLTVWEQVGDQFGNEVVFSITVSKWSPFQSVINRQEQYFFVVVCALCIVDHMKSKSRRRRVSIVVFKDRFRLCWGCWNVLAWSVCVCVFNPCLCLWLCR